MTLDDFLPYILSGAKGCPDAVAKFQARLAIIELCREALIWRESQTAVPTVALQTAYAYAPAAGQQVLKLLTVTLAGVDTEVVDPRIGRLRDSDGTTTPYVYGTFAGFEFRPAQAAGLSIVTYSVVAPTLAATTVPDSLGRYAEGIAFGSLARILSTKDKEYYDPAGAARAAALWMDAIEGAKSDGFNGSARVAQRTAKVWF